MKYSARKEYPDFIKYIPRKAAGKVSKETGLPAALIKQIRAGTVKNFSPKTENTLANYFIKHWEKRLISKGVKETRARELSQSAPLDMLRQEFKIQTGANKLHRNNGFRKDAAIQALKYETPEKIEKLIDKNFKIAEQIAAARRERDKGTKGAKHHTTENILRQMSYDNTRTADQWLWIAKNGSPKSKKSHHKATYLKHPHKKRKGKK